MSENEKEPIINPEDVSDLAEKQSEATRLSTMAGILLGLISVMILHNVYSIYKMVFDDTIPLVNCPREFSLDRPVILNSVREMDKVTTDNWVKGFIINYTMKLFPRNTTDSKDFFQYIATRSSGVIQSRYEARVKDIKNVNRSIESGSYTKFWIADSEKIIIRKVSNGVWNAVVYGYMHKRSNNELVKMQPKVELTIESVGSSRSNPEGLVVTDLRFSQITDPVSGQEVEF